jgi:uncharacterized small protein (DUF1192 family)
MRATTATCSNCEALAAEVADLRASVALLKEQVATLKEELAKAKNDSSTSSKPPSSDIINPDKKTYDTAGPENAKLRQASSRCDP